jgi:hypothetical protein
MGTVGMSGSPRKIVSETRISEVIDIASLAASNIAGIDMIGSKEALW